MPTLRQFNHLLLALALVANGWIGGAATALHAQHATMTAEQAAPVAMSDCHEMADGMAASHAVDPGSDPDCCDQGQCNCGCLHHAPIAVPFFTMLESVAFRTLPETRRMTSIPSAPVEPAIRPPIAA